MGVPWLFCPLYRLTYGVWAAFRIIHSNESFGNPFLQESECLQAYAMLLCLHLWPLYLDHFTRLRGSRPLAM